MDDVAREDEDRYQILARASLAVSGGRVLKHGETFAVFDRQGNIRPAGTIGAEGLYHEGTRFLSAMRLRIERQQLLLLSSAVRANNVLLAVDLMNPDLQRNSAPLLAHGLLHVFRSTFLWNATCYDRVKISNYGAAPLDVRLELELAADFVDVFEVRGTPRAKRGVLHPSQSTGDGLLLSYTGVDGELRSTRIQFAPKPFECTAGGARFELHLEAKQTEDIFVTITCETKQSPSRAPLPFDEAYVNACAAVGSREQSECKISTSNAAFNAWVHRSATDLRMLITDTPHGLYPYAGVPWYSTPFGRDGILTAIETLWFNPDLARGVLSFLAATQADREDPDADAEPGKIVHELRMGEMAALHEIPFGRYYGSADATPLFVMLAAAYHEVSGDAEFIEGLWPNVERALDWLTDYGDLDGDGFFEYGRRSQDGLIHQGWKDSWDAISHSDGNLADGPIALCEVQGYAYAAFRGAARLASALSKPEMARKLNERAVALRAQFDEAFWCEDLSTYALALDGQKRPCRVRTSNPGHCLFTGIAFPSRAEPLAKQLLSPELFSGWGIRTLASCELRYNPMSYHNGSIWPHDNAVIAAGFAAYGLKDAALRLMCGMFDASVFVELNRLPELFCGFPRRPDEGPTLYPVACAPQAWAAAAPFLLLQSALGLSIEQREARLRFDHPCLPTFLEEVQIDNLRVGPARANLRLHRYPDNVGIHIAERRGRVQVIAAI